MKAVNTLQIMWLLALLLSAPTVLEGQEEPSEEADKEAENKLTISGSVDVYFKQDFSGELGGESNISGNENYTFFAPDHNSFSIGMANIIAEQTLGKSSFVADISFGPRGASSSILTQNESDGSFHIQNLYVSHALSENVSITAGFMGTFVGYEVISPTGNFNYSTSHLFSWGPFQNAGIKVDLALSEKWGLMLGVFNDWNTYSDANAGKDLGMQLSYTIAEGSNLYFNVISGADSGTELDLTAGFQLSDEFYLGLNAATYRSPNSDKKIFHTGDSGFSGVALYPQFAISDNFTLGLRSEYFSERSVNDIFKGDYFNTASVFSNTLSANINLGPLTLIPEIRLDSSSEEIYLNRQGFPTIGAGEFIIAAVYGF